MTYKILKAVYALFLLPVFLLCGCNLSHSDAQNDIVSDFTANFSAEYKEMKINGKLSSNSHRLLDIVITSPKTLSGLEISYKSGELQLIRDDMICSADEAYIPDESFPEILKTIMTGISDGRAVLAAAEDNNTYTLSTAYGDAVIRTDSDGRLICAELRDKQFRIEFETE